MPLVSIITPLHNKGPFIHETLDSVKSQTCTDWEMIVVENNSTDDGPQRVAEFANSDKRFTLVDASSRANGPASARNVGLGIATGRWILHLDADDLLAPSYLQRKLEVAQRNPDAQIIAGGWQEFVDQSCDPWIIKKPSCWKKSHRELLNSAFAFAPWAVHAALIQKTAALRNGGWPVEMDVLASEDNVFWFRVLNSSAFAWDEDDGAIYRKSTPSCRDEIGHNLSAKARVALATLRMNKEFLKSFGTNPSPEMYAMAFRVLRTLSQELESAGKMELNNNVKHQMLSHLKRTSWLDFRMVFNRLFKIQS